MALGLPFLMALPEEVDFETLYDALRMRCSRFISDKEEAAHFKNSGLLYQSTLHDYSFWVSLVLRA